jgi:ribonuclease P protein subunit RPR2
MIEESAGTQFDPEVVAAFLQIPLERLESIRLEAGD